MARRTDRGRIPSRRVAHLVAAAVLVSCASLSVVLPARGAPPAWQRNATLGNGASYTGSGQGPALASNPLRLAATSNLPAEDPEEARRCVAGTLDPAVVTGKTVLCDMGLNSPAEKATVVKNAGGVGLILANVVAGPLTADILAVPTIHVDPTPAAAIRAYIAGTASPTVSLSVGLRLFAVSTTTLAPSRSPSTAGTPVTFTASIDAGSLEPTGTVAFTGLGVPIPGCVAVAVAAGQATCTLSPLVAGAYSIEAAYSGDDGLDPSSGTWIQQVNAAQPGPRPPVRPPVVLKPAISDLQLGSRCVRRSRSGRVRVAMSMALARPAALQVLVERAVGSTARRRCPGGNQLAGPQTRFRPAATIDRGLTGAAAPRRVTLRLRLKPGLYRLTVRAQLPDESLSRPVRGFVRVLR